ncbi:cellulose -beta-cellobiosidase [Colletotrichum plurivorum]|uniref:Glucanase n=1 Tax=Colletotrichum plurivorum TaxID=2175906 RepID=A0A8H6MVQ0_9PEZI|nr:cellulose -beta-cellobiosidase [Colletotrichum plurivorum]
MYTKLTTVLLALAQGLAIANAQQVGKEQTETHPKMSWQKCTAPGRCSTVNGEVVLDSNWRWLHDKNGYTNCYTGNSWNETICSDGKKCAENCALDGADYPKTYGVTTSGNALTLKFSTTHEFGTNIGSRMYLMESASKYQMFNLLGNEFAFDVELSSLVCGLNGALYFVSMDSDGGMKRFPTNKAGAKYGTGYCDSQCARDLKFINGIANVDGWNTGSDENTGIGKLGACCAEMDIWEANSISTAFTPHPCEKNEYHSCEGIDCGGTYSEERYNGDCDPDGCDYNPYRHGHVDFYGKGMTVDTSKKFTVVTQFHGSGTNLEEISMYFIQGGQKIQMPESVHVPGFNSVSGEFCDAVKDVFGDSGKFQEVGGLPQMADALSKPMVLVMSLWDDAFANMLWLDSAYPLDRDESEPGVARGSCPRDSGKPDEVRQTAKNAKVTFSNIKFGPVGSTY